MMKSKKIIRTIIGLVLLTVCLAGCNSEVAETTAASETSATSAVNPTTEVMYEPLEASVCQTLQQEATTALGVDFSLENPAPFIDEVTGESGEGCTISAKGDGTVFSDPQTVVQTLVQSVGLGWNELIDYVADGPTGSSVGLSRDMGLMIISANWDLAEGVTCPSDQPISACELTAEQKVYTVKVDVAQYKADFSMDGHWVDEATGFTLDLYQDWKNIWGQHTIVAQDGNKIDSLEASIEGRLNGKVATVTYKSSFTDQTGTAEITYIDVNTIQWKVITAPDGENYFPAEATLIRSAE